MMTLIVDPSRSYRRLLSSILAVNGSTSVEVSSYEEALPVVKAHPFNLICMSLVLPDGDSSKLVSRIRADRSNRSTPILMLTSNYTHGLQEKAYSLGVTEVFRKDDIIHVEYYLGQFSKQLERLDYQSGRILYAEDSVSVARATIEILGQCGHKVDHFTSAEDALQAFSDQDYDLVLTDILLEGELSGTSLVRAIRNSSEQYKREVPVVAMSSFSDNARRMELFRSGISDYVQKPVFGEELLARVNNLMQTQQLLVRLSSYQEELKKMALVDQLTGLYNRHFLMETIPKRIAQAQRQHYELSLVMVDIDNFKQINDTQGHAVGDDVLAAVAVELKAGTRSEDVVSRYGGEEFVILLDHCNLESAVTKAESLRRKVEQLQPSGITVTASFGVASMLAEKDNFSSMFDRVDKAVYQAKDAGRNQVMMAAG